MHSLSGCIHAEELIFSSTIISAQRGGLGFVAGFHSPQAAANTFTKVLETVVPNPIEINKFLTA